MPWRRSRDGGERDESDFTFSESGATISEKKTGEIYKRAIFDALGVTDAKSNGIRCFIERGGWLLFLIPRDFTPEEHSVQTATVLGFRVS